MKASRSTSSATAQLIEIAMATIINVFSKQESMCKSSLKVESAYSKFNFLLLCCPMEIERMLNKKEGQSCRKWRGSFAVAEFGKLVWSQIISHELEVYTVIWITTWIIPSNEASTLDRLKREQEFCQSNN